MYSNTLLEKKLVTNMEKMFYTEYLNRPYCTIDTPFEEIGFYKCHKKFLDIEMFDVLCELQRKYKEQQRTINYLEKRLYEYEMNERGQ